MGTAVSAAASPGLRPGFFLAPGMRVGLYGGSFDPAHEGHLHVAETARRRLGLDQVLWLVAPQNPLKTHRASAALAKRVAGVRHLARRPSMRVTDIEARLGLVYTIDTVRWFKRRFAGVRFVWIMGADSLAGFHRWKGWAELMREAPIAVVSRPGIALRSRLSPAARRFAFARRSALTARARAPAWVYLTGPFHHVSSTALRGDRATRPN